jgi:transposase
MLSLSKIRRYFLYRPPADMRKGFDGLCGLVRNELGADPLSGDVFIFLNRQRNRIKLLVWENDGFSIYYKRLEQGTYQLPRATDHEPSVRLSAADLLLILEGVELESVKRRKRFSRANSLQKPML